MDDVDVRESRNRNGETHGGRGGFVAPTDSPSRRGAILPSRRTWIEWCNIRCWRRVSFDEAMRGFRGCEVGWVEGGMDLWYMVEREGGWNLFFWVSLMRFIDISVLNLGGLDKGLVYGEGVIPSEYFI